MDFPTIHQSFEHHVEQANTVVVFIHGICETPNQFKEMARMCNEKGLSTVVPLLPGHGGSGRSFAKSKLEHWEAHVDAVISHACSAYQSVVLVGHSMGALLALCACEKYKEKIRGLVLVATPLHMQLLPRGMRIGIKCAFRFGLENDVYAMAATNNCSIAQSTFFTYMRWLPRYVDLFRLANKAMDIGTSIKVPTLLVHSHGDEYVREKSIVVLAGQIKHAKILRLPDSSHAYYDPHDYETLLQTFASFVDTIRYAQHEKAY